MIVTTLNSSTPTGISPSHQESTSLVGNASTAYYQQKNTRIVSSKSTKLAIPFVNNIKKHSTTSFSLAYILKQHGLLPHGLLIFTTNKISQLNNSSKPGISRKTHYQITSFLYWIIICSKLAWNLWKERCNQAKPNHPIS